MRVYTVYVVSNTVTGALYIGQTSQKLAKYWRGLVYSALDGSRDRPRLNNAIRKYGAKAFSVKPLVIVGARADAAYYEVGLIRAFKTRAGGYNLSDGGDGSPGHIVGQHVRLAVAAQNRARQHSDETRRRISISNTGKKRPDFAARLRLRKGLPSVLKGRKRGPMSEESKARLSMSHKTSEKASAHRAALALGRRGKPGKPHSIETRQKMAPLIRQALAKRKEALGACSRGMAELSA